MATLFVDKIDPQSGTSLEIGSSGDTISKGSGVVSRLGVFESQLLHVRDEKGSEVHGGASIAGTQTREFNTVKTNEITGASLSSNQITLPAGTYYFIASAPNYRTNYSNISLYNVTDSSLILNSTTAYLYSPSNITSTSNVSGRFTIASQKVLELRNYTEIAQSSHGLGLKVLDTSVISVFADLQIWRTA